MPRPLRKTARGKSHHIYSRCIEKRKMLSDIFSAELLVEVINLSQKKYDYEMIAYQIMDNHFHFMIRTLPHGQSISRIMQFIKSQFALRFNKITNRTGPFWNERFKDIVIDDADNPRHYLLWLLWYLAFNPIRSWGRGDARKFRYSSINCYLDENYRGPVRITLHSFFMELGRNFSERVKAFLWYEEAYRKRWAILFE